MALSLMSVGSGGLLATGPTYCECRRHCPEQDVKLQETTMSPMESLAKKIGASPGIGQPTAECQLLWPSRRKLVT